MKDKVYRCSHINRFDPTCHVCPHRLYHKKMRNDKKAIYCYQKWCSRCKPIETRKETK